MPSLPSGTTNSTKDMWIGHETLLEEALETAREFRFGLVEGGALLELAEVAGKQGDANQAATYLQDAETKFRELGHGLIVADGLNHSGYLALRQGDHERARRLIEEALAVARESGALSEVARFVCNLGDVLRASGDVPGAAVQYRDALVLAQETGDSARTTGCLVGLAGLATDTGRNQEASRLFGAVEALRETVGIPPWRYEEERQTQDMATVREALGSEADAEARAAGRALPAADCRERGPCARRRDRACHGPGRPAQCRWRAIVSDSVASMSVPADIDGVFKPLVVVPCGHRKIWDGEPFRGPTLSAAATDTGTPIRLNRQYARALRRCLGRDRCQVRLYQARGPHSRILDEVSLEYLATGPIAFDRLRQQMREQQLDRYPVIVGLGAPIGLG